MGKEDAQEIHAIAQGMSCRALKRSPARDRRVWLRRRCAYPPRFPHSSEGLIVSKHEIIDHIRRINTSALPEFLAAFSDEDLLEYLHELQELQREQLHRHSSESILVGQS